MSTTADYAMSQPIGERSRDLEQLRLAAIYHYVFAAMTVLFSITLVFPLLGAIEHKRFMESLESDPNFRRYFSGTADESVWMIVIIAAALAIAGKLLAAHRSRAFCIGTAAICCMVIPSARCSARSRSRCSIARVCETCSTIPRDRLVRLQMPTSQQHRRPRSPPSSVAPRRSHLPRLPAPDREIARPPSRGTTA